MIPIRDSIPCRTRPFVCWVIIAVCINVFLVMQVLPPQVQHYLLNVYGMVPIRYENPQWGVYFHIPFDYGLSFVTSLFLHGGWFHLIINMVFMWIFADNIEDRMGHWVFAGFYLVCGLCATAIQWYFSPTLATPVVGASGAIAGVLGAYFFLYPYARVIVWVPLLFLPIFVEVPAIAFLGFWVILQLNDATSSIMFPNEPVDVAWWAHLGGFIAGMLLHPLFIKKQPLEAEAEE